MGMGELQLDIYAQVNDFLSLIIKKNSFFCSVFNENMV